MLTLSQSRLAILRNESPPHGTDVFAWRFARVPSDQHEVIEVNPKPCRDRALRSTPVGTAGGVPKKLQVSASVSYSDGVCACFRFSGSLRGSAGVGFGIGSFAAAS